MRPAREVLVVDDDDDVREALALVLEDGGYRPVEAKNGDDALRRVHEHGPFTVVVLDVCMPGKSGLDVLRELRRDHACACPVVVLSGDARVRGELADLGVVWLLKPIDAGTLLAAIGSLLS